MNEDNRLSALAAVIGFLDTLTRLSVPGDRVSALLLAALVVLAGLVMR